ncbi:hypothetical protein [Paenibacillus cisolokensis]|uniref:hypothetical protein n=1 Tax=Paenibacillus cisolokensis TaxID=1658519 RepID=UPI001BCEE9E8|nr:hypothetical protein [Paenibacillus cisolokensis]
MHKRRKIPADGTAAEGGSPPSPSVTHTGGAPADSNGAPNEDGLDGRPDSDGGAANGNAGSDGGAPDRPGVSTPEADAGGNAAGSGDPGADPGTAPGTDPGAVSGTVPDTGGNGARDDRSDESDEGLVPYDGVVEHLFFIR